MKVLPVQLLVLAHVDLIKSTTVALGWRTVHKFYIDDREVTSSVRTLRKRRWIRQLMNGSVQLTPAGAEVLKELGAELLKEAAK